MAELLIPIAISSELDVTGEERIHAANTVPGASDRPVFLGIYGDLPDSHITNSINFNYTVVGGVLPNVVTLLSGSLPTGLSMNSAGNVTGTFTALGSFSWVVKVTDSAGTIAILDDSCIVTAVPSLLTGDGGAFYGPPTALVSFAGTWPTLENGADTDERAPTSADGLVLAGRNPDNSLGIWRYSAGSYVVQTITGATPGLSFASVSSWVVSDNGEWVLVSSLDNRLIYVYQYNGSGYTLANNSTSFVTNNRAICWNDDRTKVAVALDNLTIAVYNFNSLTGILTFDKSIGGSVSTSGQHLHWRGDYLLNARAGNNDSIRVLSYTTGTTHAVCSDTTTPFIDWLWDGTYAYLLSSTDLKTATLGGGILTINNTYSLGMTASNLLPTKNLSHILVPGSSDKLYSVSGAVLTSITAPTTVTGSGLWTGMV